MSNKHQESPHYHTSISTQPDHVAGRSRHAGDADDADDADDAVKQMVIDTILQKADTYGLSTKDKANLVAFAKIESGFSPDAAVPNSSASGVMQVV
jgi:hypothetical protein